MLGGPSRGPQWLRRRPGARGTWRQMLWGPKKPLPQPRPEGPPRAPPHWVIPYLMKDRNPHRFRQQSQTLVRVHGGWGWTGGGCSHLSRVPKKGPHARPARAKAPVPAMPGSRSPCPPCQGQGPRVRPSPVKIPTHKPPSRNKMKQSLSNPGAVPGLILHTGDSDTTHPSPRRPPGLAVPEGVTATPAQPGAPSSPGGATLPPEPTGIQRQGCDWGLGTRGTQV